MRRNNPLVLLLVALTICSTLAVQAGVVQAAPTDANLADQAANYLYNQYLANGTSSGGLGSFDAYVLKSAGVDISGWVNNGVALTDAVYSLADQDAGSAQATAKSLAQDLIAVQTLNSTGLVAPIQNNLRNRQNDDGSFQNDASIYSIMPAYDLLGRAGDISVVNAAYAKDYILTRQQSSVVDATYGSWGGSYGGAFYPDFMTTAEAVRALHYLDPNNPQIQQAINNGCNWLKNQQQNDGSFVAGWDDPLTDTAEAVATQQALYSTAASWQNGGKSAADYLGAITPNNDGSFGLYGNIMDATWALDAFYQLGQHPHGIYFVVSPSSKTLTAGGTVQLTASQLNASLQSTDVTQSVTWSVANDVYASVDNHGLVTALKAGTTTVTAVYDGLTALANLTVQASGGNSGSTECSVGVAVVGMNGEKLFGPATISVSPGNRWGLTALGALDTAIGSSSFVVSNGSYGYWVTSIKGQANGTPSSTAGWMFTVNDTAPMVGADKCTVSDGDHVIWYYSKTMDQAAPTWDSLSSGGSLGTPGVSSTTGSASVDPAAGGTVSLGSDATVNIPAGALNGTTTVDVTVQKVGVPPTAPTGFRLLGSAYQFTVGGSTGYKFAKPVTLTFSFNPAALSPGETPLVYYYDESQKQWVSLGGAVSGSTITVSVGHFTKFAVLAGKTAVPVAPATASTTPASFSDVPASYWAHDAISGLSGLGYVAGYPDGAFKPANQITRAEFVSILNKVLKLSAAPAGAGTRPAAPDFSDVATGDWYYQSVENVVYAGIVKGYGHTFDPNRQITREEMATILVSALDKQGEAKASMSARTDFTDDTGISDWARGFVAVAVRDGLIRGYAEDNSSRPKNGATRAEACAMIMNFLNIYRQDNSMQ